MRQAVVLAAGTGSRLRPLTDACPKCLLDVGGSTILDRLIERLDDAGVRSGAIVTGHMAGLVAEHLRQHPPPFKLIPAPNPAYATTNNVVSLQAARPHLGSGSLIVCDGDVVLHGDGLRRLAEEPEACAFLVDRETALSDEEMKVVLNADGCVTMLSKAVDPRKAAGESIGVQKVGGPALQRLWEILDELVGSGRTDVYYEQAFQQLIDEGTRFRAVPIASREWTEIDSPDDLDDARARFAGR